MVEHLDRDRLTAVGNHHGASGHGIGGERVEAWRVGSASQEVSFPAAVCVAIEIGLPQIPVSASILVDVWLHEGERARAVVHARRRTGAVGGIVGQRPRRRGCVVAHCRPDLERRAGRPRRRTGRPKRREHEPGDQANALRKSAPRTHAVQANPPLLLTPKAAVRADHLASRVRGLVGA